MKEVVILSSVRSAGGAFGGALRGVSAPELGVHVAREAIARSGVAPEHFDETVVGHGWQAGVGPNSARLISVGAGLPKETPAYTVNKRCGSSIKAAALAAQAIRAGDAEVVLAGGVESTSNVPFVNPGARWGNRFGHAQFLDLIYKDGYEDPLSGQLMGVTAENLVERYKSEPRGTGRIRPRKPGEGDGSGRGREIRRGDRAPRTQGAQGRGFRIRARRRRRAAACRWRNSVGLSPCSTRTAR